MLRLFLLITAFLIFGTNCSDEQPKTQKNRPVFCWCIGIQDGDTITVKTKNNKQYKIRLAHIDCPEKRQPFGSKAKEFTSNFCFDKKLKVIFEGKRDRNGRIIGVVFNEKEENLNKALIEAGLAWHYKKYSSDPIYGQLETISRLKKIGLWQDPNPIAPWEWRN